jgi:hypothetical protein
MAARQQKESAFETLILGQLKEIGSKVEESLELSRANNQEIKSLRRELGLEGEHGRLPSVEMELKRITERADRLELRIGAVEVARIETRAKTGLVTTVVGFFSGGLGAAMFVAVLHWLGFK